MLHAGCGVQDSEIAGNGDAGVVMEGGDRATLTPGGHFAPLARLLYYFADALSPFLFKRLINVEWDAAE